MKQRSHDKPDRKRAQSFPREQVRGGGWRRQAARRPLLPPAGPRLRQKARRRQGASADADERASGRNNWAGGSEPGMRGGR